MTRLTKLLLVLPVSLALTPVAEAPAAASCADIYPAMALGPFPADAPTSTQLFYASDGAASGSFSVRFSGFACGSSDVRVDAEYGDMPGSATEPADYDVPAGQRTPKVCEVGCPKEAAVSFPITADTEAEQVTETFTIVLSNAMGGSLDPPSSAPFLLVDDDGATRVAFDSLAYSQSESYDTLAVPVWRAGPTVGTTEVPYAAGPGPSSPATANDDYTVTSPNPLVFGPGDLVELITLRVVNDEITEPDETVELALQAPNGAALDSPATKTVTIRDNEESILPQSRFHHPKQGWRYRPDDFRIREVHVFTNDQGGSEVVRAHMALRQNLKGDRCAWYVGNRFKRGRCGNQRWLLLHRYEPDFFYHRFKALRPTGGRIDSYTAYSRATDGAGNLERSFTRGRNKNTFEIKKGRR